MSTVQSYVPETPEQIEQMWQEIQLSLNIGRHKHYQCGCVTIYNGPNDPEQPKVRCDGLNFLRERFFELTHKVEKYGNNPQWSPAARLKAEQDLELAENALVNHFVGSKFHWVEELK